MARVNGRMAGSNRLNGCSYGCCGHQSKSYNRHRELQEELELAAEEVDETPTTQQYAYEHWDAPEDEAWNIEFADTVPGITFVPADPDPWGIENDEKNVRYAKFIPAPEDTSEWYSEDCPPDCQQCQ